MAAAEAAARIFTLWVCSQPARPTSFGNELELDLQQSRFEVAAEVPNTMFSNPQNEREGQLF